MANSILVSLLFISVVVVVSAKLPDADLSVPGLIKYWGYPAETHEAITDDGYVLTLHRIKHGKKTNTTKESTTKESTTKESTTKERPIFFLQHALLDSSASFVLNLPHQSLGFVLADAGFDVWMGNARGNTYSKKHLRLNTSSNAFWDFSFDEMARYDLPAMIDHVLNETHQKQIYYVGYSQGNMMAFAGLSERKDLQKKIKLFFALGPVTRICHVSKAMKRLATHEHQLRWWFKFFQINEFFPTSKAFRRFGQAFCTFAPKLCEIVIFLIAGYDRKNLNETRIPLYLTYTPAGTSTKNMLHYAQLVNSQLFRKYDYGREGNIRHYSSKIPPEYDIGKVHVPTVLIYGSKDKLSTPGDVKWTSQHLPHVIKQFEVDGYNHLDFVWAISATEKVYEKMIDIAHKT